MYNYQKDQQLESGETKSIVEKKKRKKIFILQRHEIKSKKDELEKKFRKKSKYRGKNAYPHLHITY